MTGVIIDRRSEAYTLQEPVWLTARMSVDYDMVKRTAKGETIGSLPSFYPLDFFRKTVIDGAKRWLRDMAVQNQNYELVGSELDIKVWAPLRPRIGFDRPLTASYARAEGISSEDWPFPLGKADVVLGAYFKAKYAVPTEIGVSLPQEPQEAEA